MGADMLWIGLLSAAAAFGALIVLLLVALRMDHEQYPIVGDGSLLGRDDLRQDFQNKAEGA
jgi:hypothetical protein